MLCTAHKQIRACTIRDRAAKVYKLCEQQPHSWDVFLHKKIPPLDKLINQQEGILAYKVINFVYLLGDILADRHELDHYQLRNYENLRIPLHSTTHNQLFIRYKLIELSKLGIVYLVIYIAHHPSPVLGTNKNECSITSISLLISYIKINAGNIRPAKSVINSSYCIHLVRQVHPNIVVKTGYINM